MNNKTLQFASGFLLMVVGIWSWSYDYTQYVTGIGFIAWGAGGMLLAWISKNVEGDGKSRSRLLIEILYTVGCLLVIIGLFRRR